MCRREDVCTFVVASVIKVHLLEVVYFIDDFGRGGKILARLGREAVGTQNGH